LDQNLIWSSFIRALSYLAATEGFTTYNSSSESQSTDKCNYIAATTDVRKRINNSPKLRPSSHEIMKQILSFEKKMTEDLFVQTFSCFHSLLWPSQGSHLEVSQMGEIRSSRSHFVRLADAWQINTAQKIWFLTVLLLKIFMMKNIQNIHSILIKKIDSVTNEQ
jgi:hypothetical protein